MNNLKGDYDDEIMVLQSIYEDKLIVDENNSDNVTTLSMMVYPSTAEDVASQYVKILLELTIYNNCPEMPVQVNIKTSRGLSDERLSNICLKLREHAQASVGLSVLFDLIELAKDSLTSNNLPSCPCPICLANFQEVDDFFKTECYHYLHSYCMHQYVLHWEESNKKTVTPDQRHMRQTSIKGKHIPCPVCRNMIPYDLEELSSGIQPVEVTPNNFDLDSVKREVKKMETVYKRQQEKGGIIDIEAEKNKYLLSSIEQAHAAANRASSSSLSQAREKKSSKPEKKEETGDVAKEKNPSSVEKKGSSVGVVRKENINDEKKENSADVAKRENSEKGKGSSEKYKHNHLRTHQHPRHFHRRQHTRGNYSRANSRTRLHSGPQSGQTQPHFHDKYAQNRENSRTNPQRKHSAKPTDKHPKYQKHSKCRNDISQSVSADK